MQPPRQQIMRCRTRWHGLCWAWLDCLTSHAAQPAHEVFSMPDLNRQPHPRIPCHKHDYRSDSARVCSPYPHLPPEACEGRAHAQVHGQARLHVPCPRAPREVALRLQLGELRGIVCVCAAPTRPSARRHAPGVLLPSAQCQHSCTAVLAIYCHPRSSVSAGSSIHESARRSATRAE